MSNSNNIVSAQWLLDAITSPTVKLVDGSWYLPQQNRDAIGEYNKGHIPGAVFYDLDAYSDQSSSLPHTLPSPADFGKTIGQLGISNEDHVIVYDGMGLFSAARIWWMFKTFGHKTVSILDGGMPAWVTAGGATEADAPSPVSVAPYEASFDAERIADWQAVAQMSKTGSSQILDARAADRFAGIVPEPRTGLKSGHIPGSGNLPIPTLIEDGRLKNAAELKTAFEAAGIDLSRPVTTSCGSGVTAAVLSLGLAQLGHTDNKLYDGSWSEWGGLDETADMIETGS
ncbi:MAG: 3-mercaptopyruvate sulfurtransferase [Hyphomicrobiales bacterium]|nr:MAG: 3-mercaptopyruvate sulfurtransferase [Hyphomicrobiales bacterium]